MSWRPLSLDQELSDPGLRRFFAAGGSDWIAVEIGEGPKRSVEARNNLRWITGQCGRRAIAGWFSPQTTIAAIALRHGVLADRAVAIAGLSRRLFRDPLVRHRTGDWWTIDSLLKAMPSVPGRCDLAVGRVDEVKQTYGRMLGDIAYRIENSALFDPTVPTTRQFEAAMAMWADVTERMDEAEVVRRAGMVQLTFDAARAHAETVGLAHLPVTAVDDARRAAKASRLAASSTNPAERDAGLRTAISILSALALPYLPGADSIRTALPRAD